ncbi:MAG: peptidoglycan DD-metalloendopeptidase family protein, partial [Egibacteraceae bacterium]
ARAALGGRVTFAGRVAGVGWVTVDHGGGLSTTYGPLTPRVVVAGDVVASGEVLGRLAEGATHLDWGARLDGDYVDPLGLLGPWEVHLVHPDRADDPPVGAVALRAPPPRAGGGGGLVRPVAGVITSGFGPRVHPVTGERRGHEGLDIAAASGTQVGAAGAGTVTHAGSAGGYGFLVTVDHGGGLSTRYGHLSRIGVTVGERLRVGQSLGAVGSTGLSTGPHLHFEVRARGVPQDPARWLGG